MRTPQLKILFVVLAALVCSSVVAATVWKWVDKNGVTHYSDQPVTGAVQVDLNAQTYDAEEAVILPRPTEPPPRAAASTYQSIAIASPTNEQTFSGTGGQVSVSVQVDPGVQSGHSIRLELDGLRVSEPNSATTTFQLKDVPRGAHTLSASVVTRDGRVLIQSPSVTFFVQQQSVLRKK